MKKEEIFEYVKKQYGTVPEYLWAQSPDNAVLRHKNGKWYAVVMTVEKSKLGLEGKDPVDIRFQCLSPAKKYKLYKSSINKSIHFVKRSLSSSTRVQRVTAQLNLSRE